MAFEVHVLDLDGRSREIPLGGLAGLPEVEVRPAQGTFDGCALAVLAALALDAALQGSRTALADELVRHARRGGFVLALGAAYPLVGTEVVDQRSGRVHPALKLVNCRARVDGHSREVPCRARAAVLFEGAYALRALDFGSVVLHPPAQPWFFIERAQGREEAAGLVSGDGHVLGAPFVDLLAHRAVAEGIIAHVRRCARRSEEEVAR